MSRSNSNLPRLSISLLLILGLHIGLGVLALNWRVEAAPVESPPATILLELAPQPAVAPPPVPAAILHAARAPELVVAPKPRLVLENPKSKPAAKTLKPRPTPPAPAVTPVRQAAPTSATAAAAAPAAEQPSASASSAMAAAKASWQSRLLSHLARYKNYPDVARRRGIEGTCHARFKLDSSGKVLSVELTKSSGNVAIDRATLAMIRRASPVPAPPTELLSDGQLAIVAPFIYALEPR
jgi:protein TonB